MCVTWLALDHTLSLPNTCCNIGVASLISVTWLIYMWDMTHLYVWHDSFVRVTWLIHIYSYMWHDSFIRVTWLIYTCDMTYQYRFICVPWLALELIVLAFYIWSIYLLQYWCSVIHMCGMTHSYKWHDPCIRATWLIHIDSYVWHDSLLITFLECMLDVQGGEDS